MDVTRFLCVSLGSSTVQFHDSIGSLRACECSEAGFSSRNGGRSWGVCYRRAASVVRFLWEKGLSAKDIHNDVSCLRWECLSRKAVHKWVEKRGKGFADDEEVDMEARKLLRQQSEDFYTVGYALVKRWDKCISVGGGYVEKQKFFPRFEYQMFYVLYSFAAYLLTLPRNMTLWTEIMKLHECKFLHLPVTSFLLGPLFIRTLQFNFSDSPLHPNLKGNSVI
jgi:hypothetical protein